MPFSSSASRQFCGARNCQKSFFIYPRNVRQVSTAANMFRRDNALDKRINQYNPDSFVGSAQKHMFFKPIKRQLSTSKWTHQRSDNASSSLTASKTVTYPSLPGIHVTFPRRRKKEYSTFSGESTRSSIHNISILGEDSILKASYCTSESISDINALFLPHQRSRSQYWKNDTSKSNKIETCAMFGSALVLFIPFL